MKYCCVLVFFFIGILGLHAQQEAVLPVDEQGKLIYYEVVPLKIAADTLRSRAMQFFQHKSAAWKSVGGAGDTAIYAKGKFVIQKTLLVMSHPSGEITFNFNLGIKPGRYRFWISDFVFIPYQRDRYGNFVPGTAVGTPLENNPGKLNAAQWKEYQLQATAFAKDLAVKFKKAMAAENPVDDRASEKKVVRKDWE